MLKTILNICMATLRRGKNMHSIGPLEKVMEFKQKMQENVLQPSENILNQ